MLIYSEKLKSNRVVQGDAGRDSKLGIDLPDLKLKFCGSNI